MRHASLSKSGPLEHTVRMTEGPCSFSQPFSAAMSVYLEILELLAPRPGVWGKRVKRLDVTGRVVSAVVAAWPHARSVLGSQFSVLGNHRWKHLQPTAAHSSNREIKLAIYDLTMAGSIQPVRIEGRYFWVDGKRVGVLPLWGAILHGLTNLLTSLVGRSSS